MVCAFFENINELSIDIWFVRIGQCLCQTLSSSTFVSSPLYGSSCSPSLVD